MSAPRAVIYDVSGTYAQHWHASSGEDLSFARERTLRDVRRACEGASYVALCFDRPGKTFRHELADDYKANREAKPQSYIEELRKTEADLCREFHGFACKGYEADDVCATVCAWLLDAVPEVAVTVYSADKDLLYLVGDSVTVVSTKTGVEHNPAAVKEKLGVSPCQVPDLLAIAGDSADGIPGVRGLGRTLACELLSRFGYVPGIIRAAQENVTALHDIPKMGKAKVGALLDAIGDGSLLKAVKLTTLRSDVPIDCERILTTKEYEPEEPMSEPEFESAPPAAEPTQPSQPSPPVIEEPKEEAVAVVDAEPVSSQTTAMVPAKGGSFSTALEPHDARSAYQLAKVVVQSRMFSAYGSPQAAMMIIMAGREMGLGAMASLRSFHVVEGKPTMSAQLMMALCMKHPACKQFRVLRSQCSNEKGVVLVQRVEWDEPEVYTWTIEDAEAANLTGKNNWRKHGRQMLINRAIAEAARFTFPELMANTYSPEEINPNYEAA